MSDNSNGFRKSRVFKFINRQYQRLSDRTAIALRYLKIGLEWLLQIILSPINALMGRENKAKNSAIETNESAPDREISASTETPQQFSPPAQAKVSLLEFKKTLEIPQQDTEPEQQAENSEDVDYKELEEFTLELKQELDEYTEKENEPARGEKEVKIEQIEIKAEKADWVKEVALEAGNKQSWVEEAEKIEKISWLEDAQKATEFNEKEVETPPENWVEELTERARELNKLEEETGEKKVAEFSELESIEEDIPEFTRLETKVTPDFSELEKLEEDLEQFSDREIEKEEISFTELKQVGQEIGQFAEENSSSEFAELESISREIETEKVEEEKVTIAPETEKIAVDRVAQAENTNSLVFVPRRRERISTRIREYTSNILLPKAKRFVNENLGERVKVVVEKAKTTIENVSANNETIGKIVIKLQETIENVSSAIKTRSKGESATQLKERLKLAAEKAKIVAATIKETVVEREKRADALEEVKNFIATAKETLSEREKRANALEKTKETIGNSVNYLSDKAAEYTEKIKDKIDDLEINNANVTRFLKTRNEGSENDLELKSSILSGIQNYIKEKQQESNNNEDRKITPDWIETKATTVGYVKHPLERILSLLDLVMFWIEEFVIKVWDWSKDKIEKIRDR